MGEERQPRSEVECRQAAARIGCLRPGGRALLSGILLAVGTTFDEALETVPALIALVLMFDMTVPMVLWMRHRGHSTARLVEMTGAMLAVGLVAVVCLWAGLVESTLVRRGAYARPVHTHFGDVAA